MDTQFLFWLAPAGSLIALVFAYYFFTSMMQSDPGSEKSREIASYVKEGAMSYLWSQYRVVGIFFVVAFAFFSFLAFVLKVQSPWTPLAFLTGGFFSGLSGYLGMITATNASNRTTAAAAKSLNQGLQVAFRSGAVMGFVVVGLGLLDISIWWKILTHIMSLSETTFKDSIFAVHDYMEITTIMLTFGMGASSQALFARVGGGIFTKAADVGADLVGKTEAGIPEDDPRNPAVIADNVGDNVGDVAGMGADLYESYCGSILATAALGAAAFSAGDLAQYQLNSILLPMAIAGAGILFSLIGIYFVSTDEDASQKELMGALGRGINVSSALTAIGSAILTYYMLPEHIGILGSIITGLVAGIIIGWATEYYTSGDYPPTQEVAGQATTGPATVIIEGLATGMMSTGIPVVTVGLGIILAYGFANGFTDPSMGLYGIGIAAVGMLSTLGITLATDAYGPIADNAGGNAEMSEMGPEVRKRTDALDSLGNTTAATGKGFAIGSAALTAMALLGAYVEEVRHGLLRVAKFSESQLDSYIFVSPEKAVPIAKATMADFMAYYNVTLMNPLVLVGVFLGAMLVFVFCAMTMKAVGRAAHSMVEEVRRQFKEIPGLLKGDKGAKADYASCVAISTKGAQREMLAPSLLAIITPIVVGLVLGVGGIIGMLVGGLACGFAVAIMMANSGGAWDNAKKYIEAGNLGGKGSDNHKATVVGDTVGDPFKDTSGPSLNILIKLMSMVAVVVAGLTVSYAPTIQFYFGFNPSEVSYKEEFNKRLSAREVTLPSLTEAPGAAKSSSIFEDPLMGTEDIYLPNETDAAASIQTPKVPDVKPGEVKPLPTDSKPADKPAEGGFSGGFDAVDDKPADKPTEGGFSGGFDAIEDKPADKPVEGGFSSGFDAMDEKKDEPATTSGGFDAIESGSEEKPADEPKEEPAKPATEAAGGFEGM
ncbi:MAG: sodium-translocating pyrophosphatase [Candidatus Riflebacteria bacterium]|nr:sodium-translocating pyrophosphatase [Candidatus Riflebacteria bacterium]